MTLDEAIRHAEEVADKKEREKQKWERWLESDSDNRAVAEKESCELFAKEHRQLAEWLKDYKRLIEKDPCDTCGYEEGSIYCKEHCPHEAKIDQEPCEMTAEEYRQRMIQAFHNADCDELIAICVLPTEKEFEHLEWLLKNHYKNEPCGNAIDRSEAIKVASGYCHPANVANELAKLPPVTPQQSCEDIAKAFQLGLAFGFGEKYDEMDKVMEEVKKAVTPQPKTGHWIERDGYWECSECHAERVYGNEYCPDCGSHNGDIAKPYKEGEVEE